MCPRCKSPKFAGGTVQKDGVCWWCSQKAVASSCPDCGMVVCAPCLNGKMLKPPPQLSGGLTEDEEFTI